MMARLVAGFRWLGLWVDWGGFGCWLWIGIVCGGGG